MTIRKHCERVAAEIERLNDQELKARGFNECVSERVTVTERRKFFAIDIGTSGAWLVERETGEIFNIQGYGKPDRNKKAKADIGNIKTVDPAEMLAKRYNYLR